MSYSIKQSLALLRTCFYRTSVIVYYGGIQGESLLFYSGVIVLIVLVCLLHIIREVFGESFDGWANWDQPGNDDDGNNNDDDGQMSVLQRMIRKQKQALADATTSLQPEGRSDGE